jgi:hypothetical protein
LAFAQGVSDAECRNLHSAWEEVLSWPETTVTIAVRTISRIRAPVTFWNP